MTDGVHMGIAVYTGRSQEQTNRSYVDKNGRYLHKELDGMMQGIICITAASQHYS